MDFTKPFYVDTQMARRLGKDRPFYLPALEDEQANDKPVQSIYELDTKNKERLQQLEGRILHFENECMKCRAKKKKPIGKGIELQPEQPMSNIEQQGINNNHSNEGNESNNER